MQPSDAEREIMARIRGASARQSPESIAAERDALPSPAAAALSSEDLCTAFSTNLQRNGASVATARDRDEAVEAISQFIAGRHRQRRVVAGHDPRLAALPWRVGGILPRFALAEAGDAVAVSYARAGIAETGSVVLWLDRNNPAGNNLLCEDHVVLVEHGDIRPRLEDMWPAQDWHDPQRWPRGVMLISGPSSTADIGMQLVLGAHGPRALHVVVVGGPPPAATPPT
jgi:L-lactate dehydrogenase complex protein LldG